MALSVSSFTPSASSSSSSFMTLSGGEINFKRDIDTFRADRNSRRNGNDRRVTASRTGGSDSSDHSDASANSAQHESSKRRVISPITLNLDATTPSPTAQRHHHSDVTPVSTDDPAAPAAASGAYAMMHHHAMVDRIDGSNDVLLVATPAVATPAASSSSSSSSYSSPAISAEAKQDNSDDNVDVAIDGLSPGTRAAIQAAAAAERAESSSYSSRVAAASSSSSSSGAASVAAASAPSQEEDDMAASIALARQLMYEESMQAAQWIQRETLAAHRQQQLELANRGMSGDGASGQVDEDLLMALELAEQEQHAVEHAVPDDQEFDVEEMSYDQLMDLGSRIGSVAQQRWQLDSKHVVATLPTKELADDDIAARVAAKANQKTSSLALIVEDPTICQICQCDFEAGDHVKVLPCCHDFHVGCIDHWLKDNNSCVLCKAPVDKPAEAAAAAESSPPEKDDSSAAGERRDE